MATKEQERKALEQIRKIVEGLGENSYIGMAFEGCFEDAEGNIENDFGCSMKERWELELKKNEAMEQKINEQADQIKSLETKIVNLQNNMAARDKALEAKDYRIAELDASRKECAAQDYEHWSKLQEAETKLAEKEDEIIRLKARLFDMMMAQK